LTLHDDTKAPTVAVVNREFARKVLGSVDKAIGGHFKIWGGTRVEVVGVVEDGKYETLTEDPQPAMFYSFLQQPSTNTWIIARSERAPQEIVAALQRSLHSLDPALPLEIKTWNSELDSALFAARVATVALGVLGLLGAMLAITGIFGMASYVVTKRLRELGIRVALGANQRKVLSAALGRAFRLLAIGSVAGMILGVLATRVLSSIVYQATPKDPIVLGGVVLTMLFLGLVAAWIPAQHALAVDPMILLREE
jgi:ABC-type antimicrobial peptide transport system permease subunit